MIATATIVPDTSAEEPRRSEPRLDAKAEVGFRKLGTAAVDARLLNISSRGFMAELDGPIELGARVWLTIPGVPRANARIVWSRGCRLGGEFSEPIDPLAVLSAVGRGSGRP